MRRLHPFLILSTLGVACVGVILASSLTAHALPQSADEIVEQHLTALGGREALSKLTSRHGVGTISLALPVGELSGTVETWARTPNKSRALLSIDLSPMGMSEHMVVDQRFDGTSGWVLNSLEGNTEITGDQLAGMRNNVFPTSLMTYKEQGTTITVLPRESVSGRDAIVLQVTPKSGPGSKLYLDARTYLMIKSVTRTNAPDMGEIDQVSEASDYRAVDGVQVPFKVANSNAIQTVTITLKSVQHNVAIDDAMFSGR